MTSINKNLDSEKEIVLEECMICYEDINNKKIVCKYCNLVYCLSCFQKYLLQVETPHCMKCKKIISFNFIYNTIPKKFKKKYEEYLYNIEFKKEKNLLPYTQWLMDKEAFDFDKFKKEKKIKDEMKNIKRYYTIMLKKHKKNMEKITSLQKKEIAIEIFSNVIKYINNNMILASNKFYVNRNEEFSQKIYSKICPVNDCRGYLSKELTCGTCNTTICKNCDNSISDNHVCNPDTVLSIKSINNNSKQCPVCRIPIYKIDGCDQMWCPTCNVAFCWDTGRLETRSIHNPHYYEWQRKINNGEAPRIIQDSIPLGEMIMWEEIYDNIKTSTNDYEKNIIYNGYISATVFSSYIMERIITSDTEGLEELKITGDIERRETLRILYLRNIINEEEWKSELKNHINKINKDKLIINLIQFFVKKMEYIFRKFINTEDEYEKRNIIFELDSVKTYFIHQITIIYNKYEDFHIRYFINDFQNDMCIYTDSSLFFLSAIYVCIHRWGIKTFNEHFVLFCFVFFLFVLKVHDRCNKYVKT